MNGIVRSAVALAVFVSFLVDPPAANAEPIGDFFKRLGRSIAPPKQPTRSTARKSKARGAKTKPATVTGAASPGETRPAAPSDDTPTFPPEPSATPTPSATPPPTRLAASAPPSAGRRDVPYALPVPDRPGFVTSPYAPTRGFVDVRGFERGAEVKDPYTGKVFLVP